MKKNLRKVIYIYICVCVCMCMYVYMYVCMYNVYMGFTRGTVVKRICLPMQKTQEMRV